MSPTDAVIARQARLSAALENAGIPALILNPGPSLTYLTGLHFHLSERPVIVIFQPGAAPVIILPQLETAKLEGLGYSMKAFPYGEEPATWQAVVRQGLRQAGLTVGQAVIEPRQLRVLELRLLESASQDLKLASGEEVVASLRMQKDATEIACIQRAAEIAQNGLKAVLPMIKPGVMERDIAAELTLQLLRCGSEGEMPFTPIVSAGPNSANPHAFPSERKLAEGNLLVIDWGAAYQGYFSDITRTFAIGKVADEERRIVEIVHQANAAGRAAGRPGAACQDVDKAARDVIEAAGYGGYFTHRTGHGLGLESHEAPYMRAGNPQILETGMTYTVEPGIYLTGRNGSRIEDDMLITPEGCQSLTDLPRELVTLPL